MANIAISDLGCIGANLPLDSKSFLNDLMEKEIADVLGGLHVHIEIWKVLICFDIEL